MSWTNLPALTGLPASDWPNEVAAIARLWRAGELYYAGGSLRCRDRGVLAWVPWRLLGRYPRTDGEAWVFRASGQLLVVLDQQGAQRHVVVYDLAAWRP